MPVGRTLCAAAAAALLALVAAVDGDPDATLTKVVSYGSTIKLEHVATGFRLHSHEIPYGTGSRQQSVTAFPDAGDVNSYWQVKAAHGAPRGAGGQVVACGATVRLQHVATGRNLHSHLHRAPMSADFEVSAYRKEAEAERLGGRWFDGDTGDNWVVTCEERGAKVWGRGAIVSFKHVDTSGWLSSSKGMKFGQPIAGQLQVSAVGRKGKETSWKSNEGVYLHPAPEGMVAA
jgi:dolichyl-phosphate-mannose--protein O-mannosyl transferase